jgi:hypothetical protein
MDDLMSSKIIEFIVLSGWVLLLIVCLGVISGTVLLWMFGKPVEENFIKMALMAMSFLFGSLPAMVKDLLMKAPPPTA